MITENYIALEMTRRGVTPCIDVMQDDKYCRDLMILPHWEGFQMIYDENLTALIMYSKPDGTGGSYDKLPDGQAAYAIESPAIRVKLAPQICTVPGLVKLSLALIDGKTVVHTFVIHIKVHATPGINVKSEDYNNTDAAMKKMVNFAVTEGADGTVTMVNTFEDGSTETIQIVPDANGNPGTLIYNGTVIPGTWTEADAE